MPVPNARTEKTFLSSQQIYIMPNLACLTIFQTTKLSSTNFSASVRNRPIMPSVAMRTAIRQ